MAAPISDFFKRCWKYNSFNLLVIFKGFIINTDNTFRNLRKVENNQFVVNCSAVERINMIVGGKGTDRACDAERQRCGGRKCI